MSFQIVSVDQSALSRLHICITVSMKRGSSEISCDGGISEESAFHLEVGGAVVDIFKLSLCVSSILLLVVGVVRFTLKIIFHLTLSRHLLTLLLILTLFFILNFSDLLAFVVVVFAILLILLEVSLSTGPFDWFKSPIELIGQGFDSFTRKSKISQSLR